jgi:mono/diheme cytochrome c family protein
VKAIRVARSARTASLVLLALLTVEGRSEEPKSVIAWGKQLFGAHCASCHGADGTGNGPAAKSLKARPSDLTRISERNGGTFPRLEVVSFIDGQRPVSAHTSPEMPKWGRVFSKKGHSSPEAYAVTDYIASIQK